MADWGEGAIAEIEALKPYWVEKYAWQPDHVVGDEAIDLFVQLRSRRLDGRKFVLRLRYLSDWQSAGRREAFVSPEDRGQDGIEFWPPHDSVRGVLPQHQPPAICLRGVWGYHSVLHAAERPDGTTLLGFLLELQGVMDE